MLQMFADIVDVVHRSLMLFHLFVLVGSINLITVDHVGFNMSTSTDPF